MCNFKKFRVVFLESCLEIGLIINDLSLDSDWGHLLYFLEMPAILPNKLHTCMTSHYDIPHVNCTPWQNPKKCSTMHSFIKVVLIQSCSAGAENFTNYVFCPPQFSGVIIQNIGNRCAILNPVCLCRLLSK